MDLTGLSNQELDDFEVEEEVERDDEDEEEELSD